MAKKGETSENKANFKYTPDALAAKTQEYFDYCDTYRDGDNNPKPKPYTYYGYIDYLDICEDTFRQYLNGPVDINNPSTSDKTRNDRLGALSQVLKKGMLHIKAQVEERQDTKSIFLSKQKTYMRYADRDTDDIQQPIVIRLDTTGGKDGKK